MKKLVMLVLIFCSAIAAAQTVTRILPASGTYYEPTDLFFNVPPQMTLYYSFDSALYDVKANGKITLDPGTGRMQTYKLYYQLVSAEGFNTEKGEMSWIIDCREEPVLKTSAVPGHYQEDIDFTFLFTRNNPVYYAISQGGPDNFKLWNNEKIRLTGKIDEIVQYKVLAYAGQKQGDASRMETFYFTIDKKKSEAGVSDLKIKSPVEGSFLNRQYLVIEATGFEWLKYAINSTVKEDSPRYSVPVEIPYSGSVTVNILGSRKGSGELVTKSVKYNVTSSSISGKQGLFTTDQTVFSEGKFYSFDDSPSLLAFTAPISLSAAKGSRQDYILSIKASESSSSSERYWISIDKRVSTPPTISTEYSGNKTMVNILSLDGGTIYYTLDGKTPSISSSMYSGPVAMESSSGSVLVRAISVLNDLSTSKEASVFVQVKGKNPDKPTVTWNQEKSAFTLSSSNAEFILFTYSDKTSPAVPGVNSAFVEFSSQPDSKTIINQIELTVPVPYGMEKTLAFRFAAMDKSGNISEPTDAYNVKIDKKPPLPIKFSFGADGVSLTGEGTIYYKLGDKPAVSYTDGWQKYSSKIKIDKSGSILSAYSIDESLNYSSISSVFATVTGATQIGSFKISGINQGEQTNRSEVILSCPPPGKNLYYVYTLTTDGKEPSDPDFQSPLFTEESIFRCPDQQALTYNIKIRLVDRTTNQLGEIQSLAFTIDRILPVSPFIDGIKSGGLYNGLVTVKLSSQENERIKWLVLEKPVPNIEPELWMNYEKEIAIDVDDQSEKTFYLHACTIDKAGNVSNIISPSFTIDRKAPSSECLLANSLVVFSTSDLSIPLKTESGLSGIKYSLKKKTTKETTISEGTSETNLSLSGEMDQLTSFEITVHAFDAAGNINLTPAIYTFVIDKRMHSDSQPIVKSVFNDLWLFSWNVPLGQKGLIRIDPSSDSSGTIEYSVPFFITGQKTRAQTIVSAFLSDGNGDPVLVKEFNLSPEVSTSDYKIMGISEGTVSNQAISITCDNFGNTIRYSLSSDSTGIPVGSLSALMPKELVVDLPFGKASSYTLSLGVFDASGKQIGQTESYRFSIDRKPPSAPIVSGIVDSEYYSSDVNFSLHATEGTIYYTIIKDSYPSELLDESAYQVYTGPVSLPYSSDALFSYTVSAYTADEAGNKCAQNAVWTVYLDRDMIYVDNTVFDEGDGTRQKPLKSIQSALNVQKKNGKRIIILMPGEYRLNDTLVLPDNVYLSAKVTSSQKTPSAILSASKDFPVGRPLVIAGKDSRVSNIVFKGTAKKESALVAAAGSSLSLENCRFVIEEGRVSPAFLADSAQVKMLSCVVDAKNHAGEKIFDFKDSDLKISSSLLDIGSGAKNFSAVVSSGNKKLEITDTRINIIYGNIFALSTSNFEMLSVNRNKISVSGIQNSFVAFRGKMGTLEFLNNKFQTDSTVWLSTILEITGGTARIESNQILMSDQLGFLGFNLSSCDFTVRKNSLVSRTKGFAYFIKTTQGKGLIDNNSLFIDKARDFSAVIGISATLSILNNLITAADVTASVFYFDLESPLNTFIAGNFFENSGKAKEVYLVKTDSFTGYDLVSNYTFGNPVWFFQTKKNLKIRTARDLNGNAAFIGSGEVKGNADSLAGFSSNEGVLSASNRNNTALYPVLQDAELQALAQQKTGVPLKKAAGPYEEGQ